MVRAAYCFAGFVSILLLSALVAPNGAATDIGIDRSKLPKVSEDSTIILSLVSNQEKTKFTIEGKELGIAKRMYVLVPNKPLTIKAKPEAYIEKEDYIQPPYREYSQIGFYFLREDRESAPEPPKSSGNKTPLQQITEAAAIICQTTPVSSENNQLELDGKGNAELKGVIGKLVTGGVSGAAKYQSRSSYGVLQKELAGSITAGNTCRLKVLETLAGALLK